MNRLLLSVFGSLGSGFSFYQLPRVGIRESVLPGVRIFSKLVSAFYYEDTVDNALFPVPVIQIGASRW